MFKSESCALARMIAFLLALGLLASGCAPDREADGVRVLVDGRPTHLNVCTRCLRSGKVVRALPSIGAEA